VDCADCGFVPGTGWPEPGGFLPREALKLLGLVAAEGICGLDHGYESDRSEHGEADLDLVESAFVEGFAVATDPTSFLRLAGVPFAATAAGGAGLVLLRIETEAVTDVGSITPHLGGESFRYDPLPAALVSRRRLRFIYRGADGTRRLSFAEVRSLIPEC
jgi:Arginase family